MAECELGQSARGGRHRGDCRRHRRQSDTEETEREETERVPDAREEELATPVERADAPMLREDPPMLLDEPENPPVALLILAGRFDTQWWYPPP